MTTTSLWAAKWCRDQEVLLRANPTHGEDSIVIVPKRLDIGETSSWSWLGPLAPGGGPQRSLLTGLGAFRGTGQTK